MNRIFTVEYQIRTFFFFVIGGGGTRWFPRSDGSGPPVVSTQLGRRVNNIFARRRHRNWFRDFPLVRTRTVAAAVILFLRSFSIFHLWIITRILTDTLDSHTLTRTLDEIRAHRSTHAGFGEAHSNRVRALPRLIDYYHYHDRGRTTTTTTTTAVVFRASTATGERAIVETPPRVYERIHIYIHVYCNVRAVVSSVRVASLLRYVRSFFLFFFILFYLYSPPILLFIVYIPLLLSIVCRIIPGRTPREHGARR